ncbi:hypothetical protein D3C87_277550 [compost metagenome]
METQLVYAEVMNGISFSMLEDKLVQIISDGAVFIVTTIENSRLYPLDFYPVDSEGREAYGLRIENGKLISD